MGPVTIICFHMQPKQAIERGTNTDFVQTDPAPSSQNII